VFGYFGPVKRAYRSDMTGFRSFDNSTRVLDLLEAAYLRLKEIVVKSYVHSEPRKKWQFIFDYNFT